MYRVVVIADGSGQWAGNGMEFKSAPEAIEYAKNLFMRWTAVRQWRVIDGSGAVVTES